jgi:hypothetical protein
LIVDLKLCNRTKKCLLKNLKKIKSQKNKSRDWNVNNAVVYAEKTLARKLCEID